MLAFAMIVSSVLSFSYLADAQQRKTPLLGYVSATDKAADSARAEAIRVGLGKLGYIEGQNVAIEYRYAQGQRERYTELLAELVRVKPALIIVAGGDPLVRVALNATDAIPIIMTGGGADPVETGLVESLARPGGNATGITNVSTELGGKRLELLKEVVPRLARVAVFYDSALPASVVETKELLPAAARSLRLTLLPWEIGTGDEVEKNLAFLNNKDRPDGLYVLGGALMRTNRNRITRFALNGRLPSTYFQKEPVDVGGLMHYGVDMEASYRRVAYYVDRILKGAKPGDLPVEQPSKFELVINLKTAKQMGLIIPQKVLVKADRVIK
jgi:putative tryptophan/tyrosine transport system substrate-binding protein